MESTFLINSLLRAVSHERPLDLAALAEHGISPALAAHYARTGWLQRLAKGVYCVAGAHLDRDQCLLFLQDRVPGLHVGARTALAWQGVRQYLEAREQLTMWATARGDVRAHRRCAGRGAGCLPGAGAREFLLLGFLPSDAILDDDVSATGIVTPPAVTDGLRVSCRERALLELLRAVRTGLQLQEARELFFATLGLRVAMTGELLTGCTSVKTVRLFMMWATEAGNVDVEALRSRYDLPTGSQSRWIGTLADGTKLVLPA